MFPYLSSCDWKVEKSVKLTIVQIIDTIYYDDKLKSRPTCIQELDENLFIEHIGYHSKIYSADF